MRVMGVLKRLMRVLLEPSARWSLLALLAAGFAAGVLFWGSFNTAMEATNRLGFCTGCHEMRDNVYKEYVNTIHDRNRTGVQATCSDCHVPKDLTHKLIRKMQAANEVFHWLAGSVNTPEKFDAKRLTLAKHVWATMKASDSRECRNCHTIESMNPEFQRPRARKQHLAAMENGNTCIDCHKGIAHKSVRNLLGDKELEELEKPLTAYVRQIPPSYVEGMKRAEQQEAEAEAKHKSEIAAAAEVIAAERMKGAAHANLQGGAASSAAGLASKIDWSKVETKTVTLFYPGQSSFEWIQDPREHGGSRAFLKAGDRCSECHAKEVREIGDKIVKGIKLEPSPIPGKRGWIDVGVQAVHDGEKLYFRFQWQNAAHTPAPFVDGGKMDATNQVKLAVMIAGEGVARAEQGGCWVTCHHDARSMPDAPKPEAVKAFPGASLIDLKDGVTKYLAQSRTEVEVKGSDGKPRGGWDKLKSPDELATLLKSGTVMDLMRFRSGAAPEHGHVLAERMIEGGAPVEASATLDGDIWTVVLARPLKSDRPGVVSIEPGKLYTIGFALHDDYTAARFHHVSLEFRFGLDAPDAEINAVKQ